ncbi:unnamed protein product [Didymodactylos carnosus]|uniref:Fucosyltransferase n=1 Tax=Didymodactylos carnosus TaxID=1234261 RepID=A0A8S2DXI9_9BILA|nr:unnamed protein product [Didymodactylos carnosus]CAF3777307.1 unnamed protein product [Didymodactylos carnosus]
MSNIILPYIKDEEEKGDNFFVKQELNVPILVWWTPFTLDVGTYTSCGGKSEQCFLSNVRKYRANKDFEAFLFYGTDFRLHDLPLPRLPHEHWGLLHEESPKNSYLFSYEDIMNLFNHSATFKRNSDLPLTTQWLSSLEDLTDMKYFMSVKDKNRLQEEENLSPVIYLQSDCNTPSDRDIYIEQLMKYIKIDSYGSCLHNRDLPDHLRDPIQAMEATEILKLVGKYKFALAFENAICTDYITEKFWRPLKTGTIPVVFGSDKFNGKLKEIEPVPDNFVPLSNLRVGSDTGRGCTSLL